MRKGRKEEFASFGWSGEVPDPQDEQTFHRSRLNWESRKDGHHRLLLDFYRELFRLRREVPALARLDKHALEATAFEDQKVLLLRRWDGASHAFVVFHFGDKQSELPLALPGGIWVKRLDSSDTVWGGAGSQVPDVLNSRGEATLSISARSFVLFCRKGEPKK